MSVQSALKKLPKSRNLVDYMPIIALVVLMIVMAIGSPRFLIPRTCTVCSPKVPPCW